jgi:hypothetical protein
VASLREWLERVATQTDTSFPANEEVRMEQAKAFSANCRALPSLKSFA